ATCYSAVGSYTPDIPSVSPLIQSRMRSIFLFFNDTPTTEIYTLSLHDALPIFKDIRDEYNYPKKKGIKDECSRLLEASSLIPFRSEERFSRNAETDLVCRLLLEKKKLRSFEHTQNRTLPGLLFEPVERLLTTFA